ncbi:MAG TPA: Uma2 family endonuclease [Chryseolinea sp.]
MKVFKNLMEGTLVELMEGKLFPFASRTPDHQHVLGRLLVTLRGFIKEHNRSDALFILPLDLFLDEQANVLLPDIMVIAESNRSIIKEDAIHGRPDLIIEIFSPRDAFHEARKRVLYQRFQIPEYHMVSPQTKEIVSFILKDGKYTVSSRAQGKLHSAFLGQHTFEF